MISGSKVDGATGPLRGLVVIELAGLGPGPMAGMILADMGAEVIRVERSNKPNPRRKKDISLRGKKSVWLNLKDASDLELFLKMIEKADVLIDPYRPGVCEKLGLGPDICLKRNPRLIFGRVTGWGQDGPLAMAAGHDINYISLAGALHAIGRRGDKPVVPLNLVGDMGGGGMLLVSGILAALIEVGRSGQGQIIDAAMVDGTAQLLWMIQGWHAEDRWDDSERESNILDGGAHFYDVYECADGRYISLGSIEPNFYELLMEKTGIDPVEFCTQDKSDWCRLKQRMAEAIRSKTRDQWCELLEGTDVCFAPVLTMSEAPQHPANVARKTYIEVDGMTQAAPAPRFSRTPSTVRHGSHEVGQDTEDVLGAMGLSRNKANRRHESLAFSEK